LRSGQIAGNAVFDARRDELVAAELDDDVVDEVD
jgi:hypothetical protein